MLQGLKYTVTSWYLFDYFGTRLDFYNVWLDFYNIGLDFYNVWLDFYNTVRLLQYSKNSLFHLIKFLIYQ